MRALFFTVGIGVLVGCGSNNSISYVGMDNTEVEEVSRALVSLIDKPRMALTIEKYDEPNTFVCATATPFLNHCLIRVNTLCWDTSLEVVMWHEYGHCVGLGHSENRNDIMYKSIQYAYPQENIVSFKTEVTRRNSNASIQGLDARYSVHIHGTASHGSECGR